MIFFVRRQKSDNRDNADLFQIIRGWESKIPELLEKYDFTFNEVFTIPVATDRTG